MIKGENKKYSKQKIRIFNEIFKWRHNEVKDAKVKKSAEYLGRLIQVLYPLELHRSESKIDIKDE